METMTMTDIQAISGGQVDISTAAGIGAATGAATSAAAGAIANAVQH